ncbi:MAG: hypothetical protein ACTHJQ_19645 [Rhizobiaceae bacterium]
MSAAREVLDYRDLENELHDAVNMSNATCLLVEDAATPTDKGALVTDSEWEVLLFSIYHSNKLLLDLKAKWEAVHSSNVAARKGGAK